MTVAHETGTTKTKNLDNWEAAEIKTNQTIPAKESVKRKKHTAEKADENLAESLILAQDERWRRA